MKLQIGKTYQVRSPELMNLNHCPIHVTITHRRHDHYYGDDNDFYMQDGSWDAGTGQSIFDLVKEVEPLKEPES